MQVAGVVERLDGGYRLPYRIRKPEKDLCFRLRGTNLAPNTPGERHRHPKTQDLSTVAPFTHS